MFLGLESVGVELTQVHNNKGAMLLEKQRKAFAKNLVEAQLTHGTHTTVHHPL